MKRSLCILAIVLCSACSEGALHSLGVRAIDRAFDRVDKHCQETDNVERFARLSDRMASLFFEPASPLCSDALYSAVLEREIQSPCCQPYYQRRNASRVEMLKMAAVGTPFPIDELYCGAPAVVFVHSDYCRSCRKLERQIGRRSFVNLCKDAGIAIVGVCEADDYSGFQSLDPRYIPSLYLIDEDGTVLVRAARNLRQLRKDKSYKSYLM